MQKWFVAIVFGVLLLMSACGGEQEDTTNNTDSTESVEEVDEDETKTNNEESEEGGEANVIEVEELVKSNCASCHTGDFELVANESDLSAEEIEDIIINGVGSMPAIDSVTDEEAIIIANYLAKE